MMQLKTTAIALSMAGLGLLATSGQAQAITIGTIGFSDDLGSTVDTNNINTAGSFTLGDLIATRARSGTAFTGVPKDTDFGAVTFSPSNPASLSFSNPVFGTFSASSIAASSNTPGFVSFLFLGTATGGTGTNPVGFTTTPASFSISFNQTGGTGTSISSSSTLSIPPTGTPVPEPSEMLGTLGLGAIVAGYLAKRKISKLA